MSGGQETTGESSNIDDQNAGDIRVRPTEACLQEEGDQGKGGGGVVAGMTEEIKKMPGFRFSPTEEELVAVYLALEVQGLLPPLASTLIPHVPLYLRHPWELFAGKEMSSQKEWFCFVQRDSKPATGGRPNRRTKCGYWKATGVDKKIEVNPNYYSNLPTSYNKYFGLRKTLVYYKGRAPKGMKTSWIMNEYRLSSNNNGNNEDAETFQSSLAHCKVYNKRISTRMIQEQTLESSKCEEGRKYCKALEIEVMSNENVSSSTEPESLHSHQHNGNSYGDQQQVNGDEGFLPKYDSNQIPSIQFWENCLKL